MKASDQELHASKGAAPQASPASDGPDLRRRRLIRGAAAATPVILTLRSGAALAQVSCTGAKVLIEPSQEVPWTAIEGSVTDSDVGFRGFTDCPTDINKVLQVGAEHYKGKNKIRDNLCPDNPGPPKKDYTCTGPIAILSSTAAGSFGV